MDLKRKLSLGLADFEDMISEDKIYVDKTDMIEKIVDISRKYYFLSRPRRFGKSLFISTLKNLFEGKEELFKDTYIYENWDWNEKYTVIHLDMSNLENSSTEELKIDLEDSIETIAELNNISLNKKTSAKKKFSNLINKLSNDTGKKVVVLIDEYDKPILDNIDDEELADKNRDLLKSFRVLKIK
jgi:hypothetical protein